MTAASFQASILASSSTPELPADGKKTDTPAVSANAGVPPGSGSDCIGDAVIRRAEELLLRAAAGQTAAEHREGAKLARLMDDPAGKAFTFAMVDEVFRSHRPPVQAARFRQLLGEYGVPSYPPLIDRTMMRAGSVASCVLPGVVMPQVAKRMRADSARVILDGEPASLQRYLERRAADGFRINLNHLGEAVLGEEEAEHRMEAVLGHLADPLVTYISVKISAIFSQINLVAWETTLAEIKQRLRRLYRAALPQRKFVNLDMEEYRDLALTLAAFREVLDESEFLKLSAGVVLQAYLPDSWQAQQDLTEWAKQRVARGGADIKVRLVKGANLAMESVEAELHGWNAAPYRSKADTDANFRRMLEFGCRAENAAAVRLGVASHNLFDVALALELRTRCGTESRVELEMLEGMANHQARAVRDTAGGLLLYAPAVRRDDFLSAMAYLVRRLDENTAPENFLRDMFSLHPGTPAWEHQRGRFIRGWQERTTVQAHSFRSECGDEHRTSDPFHNEADSDWTQPAVRASLWNSLNSWQAEALPPLPDLSAMLETARIAQPGWEAAGIAARASILHEAGRVMAAQRFTTVACMRNEAKKAVPEGDAEVSEAVDFARYYARAFDALTPSAGASGLNSTALGIVAIAPPWNFPYAIPCGGVLAALMAGNAVILKPAPETVQTAWLLARQLWEAGVPRDVLHFFPCADGETGRALITDPRIAAVVLTGGYETARLFQSWRPSLRLFAETSGKNALIITAQADRELAIKDLVRSAFGHAGQKCSAASLAIIEAEVYDDPVFRRQLRDAAASLPCGHAADPRSVVTPVILEPGGKLHRALTTLEPGESWLLKPQVSPDDPCAWTPGIRLGVQPGSWFHRNECFGPVLGLMRAESLNEAIAWQNATDYGLTAGIHSLDHAEIALWRDRVQAGNLYINRPITGAIVQRQPFGGWKRSCIGPGAKAGGPDYVFSFRRFSDAGGTGAESAESSYRQAWQEYFSKERDPSGLRCESNVHRYRPCRGVILRLPHRDEAIISRARLAAEITGTPLTVITADAESDAVFIARLPDRAENAEFLRTPAGVSDEVLSAAHGAGLNWIDAPLTSNGRLELRHWLREQAVSRTMHRYGQMPEWKPAGR